MSPATPATAEVTSAPEDLDIETEWPAESPTGRPEIVELWCRANATRRTGGEVRIVNSIVVGTIAKLGSPDEEITPSPAAIRVYGEEWVAEQLAVAIEKLTRGVR